MAKLKRPTPWKVTSHTKNTICNVCMGILTRRGTKYDHLMTNGHWHTPQPIVQEAIEKTRLLPVVLPPLCPKCKHDYGCHLHLYGSPTNGYCNELVGRSLDHYCECKYTPPKSFKLPEQEWD